MIRRIALLTLVAGLCAACASESQASSRPIPSTPADRRVESINPTSSSVLRSN